MKLHEAYKTLEAFYGNHTRAAKALGVSVRSYRSYRRNGNVPKIKAAWIISRAEKIKQVAA